MIKFDFINNYDYDFDMNDLSEYDVENIGVNFSESLENSYDVFSEKIELERNRIKDIIKKKRNEIFNFYYIIIYFNK